MAADGLDDEGRPAQGEERVGRGQYAGRPGSHRSVVDWWQRVITSLKYEHIIDSIPLHLAMNVITDCESKIPTSSVRSQSVDDF